MKLSSVDVPLAAKINGLSYMTFNHACQCDCHAMLEIIRRLSVNRKNFITFHRPWRDTIDVWWHLKAKLKFFQPTCNFQSTICKCDDDLRIVWADKKFVNGRFQAQWILWRLWKRKFSFLLFPALLAFLGTFPKSNFLDFPKILSWIKLEPFSFQHHVGFYLNDCNEDLFGCQKSFLLIFFLDVFRNVIDTVYIIIMVIGWRSGTK